MAGAMDMQAGDIMTHPVIHVSPDTSVNEIAKTLLDHQISAVPVLDGAGRLVGIVSEGDLLHRAEIGTERRYSSWLEFFTSSQTLAADYVKSHSRKAIDVMTHRVVTALEETPLGEIAILMEHHRIKRVPVLRDGRVVGIVSRANLLHGLATALRPGATAEKSFDDHTIREQLLAEIRAQLWSKPWLTNVTVKDGVVDLWGRVDSNDERKAIEVMAQNAPGVRSVNNYMNVRPTAMN